MPGLVPGIHVLARGWPDHPARRRASRFSPAMTTFLRTSRVRKTQTKGRRLDAAALKLVRETITSSFRDGPKDQTSGAQLRTGESRDSPMCNCTSEVRCFASPRNDGPVSGLGEQLVDILPVHQMLDKRLQIVRAAVAIIDVIGMLPDLSLIHI